MEFADKAAALEKLGVEIEILGEKEMKKLKMAALLGVSQGATRPPRLVIMRWNGGKKNEAPLAFVGKGVVFDTGGISIKPAAGMEEMKGDMGGAAAVTGLMHALAARKAKANVIGVIGLVENMPDGNAQRPATSSRPCPEPRSRSSTPTRKAGSCWPMPCGTRRTGSNRLS